MVSPTIVVFSREPRLVSELPQKLQDTFDLQSCSDFEDAVAVVAGTRAEALVADFLWSPEGGHAQATLMEGLQERFPDLEIVMLTGDRCPEPLERLVACGDLLRFHSDGAMDELCEWLEEKSRLRQKGKKPRRTDLRKSVSSSHRADAVLHGITRRFETNTPQLHRMLLDLEIAAQHDVTVLMIGETGSGKSFLSKLIHEVSPRRNEPFLPVACGALPRELIESELFGHVKGAFTSAHADKDGKFVAAGRGTILLDEIDVLGPEQQVKLLRVIETGEFEPVGSNTTLKSQARLVVASNMDLQPLVEQGRFRPDLYYRLNMLKFEIPPLRNRKPDISVLARMFVDQLSEKHGVVIEQIDEALVDALYEYPWPGNVRELENVIQRAVIYCRDGVLSVDQLPPHILMGVAGPTNDPSVSLGGQAKSRNHLGRQIAVTERDIIEQALFKNNYSRTNTAKELGISRVTLYNKMKKYGMTK